MKEKRSLFDKIFGGNQASRNVTQLRMLNGYTPVFSNFSGEAYDSDVVRSAVHAIASNAAKLKPKHIRRTADKLDPLNTNLERMLQVRPNPYMSGYDFLYKIITQLLMRNNAFIFVKYENGIVVGLYPVLSSTVEFVETVDKEIYARFRFLGGQNITLPYSELIHIRRHFYKDDLYGETSGIALAPTLELINTTNQGIINAIKSSAFLRGLLKFTQSMLKPEDIKKERDKFVADYMDMSNNGGVAALDSKAEYQELKSEPKLINGPQMTLIEEKVYKYFGVNRNIVMSDYTEDQWNAFYESVIEPLAIQLSLEFTSKLFTQAAQSRGQEIIFEANRLQYASNKTKIELVNTLMPLGLMTTNEGREVFNMGQVKDGEKRLISLNYVDASKANLYQVGEGDNIDGKSQEGN